ADGWRERLRSMLSGRGVTNHAQGAPLTPSAIRAEGLWFRSGAELALYRALTEAARDFGGLTIIVNTRVRVTNADHTWEIDFMVACQGRLGVIEVDGPSHRGRIAAERT